MENRFEIQGEARALNERAEEIRRPEHKRSEYTVCIKNNFTFEI